MASRGAPPQVGRRNLDAQHLQQPRRALLGYRNAAAVLDPVDPACLEAMGAECRTHGTGEMRPPFREIDADPAEAAALAPDRLEIDAEPFEEAMAAPGQHRRL